MSASPESDEDAAAAAAADNDVNDAGAWDCDISGDGSDTSAPDVAPTWCDTKESKHN